MVSPESSDDENHNFQQWNNWEPPPVHPNTVEALPDDTKKVFFGENNDLNGVKSVSGMTNTVKYKNWIPPVHFEQRKDFFNFKRKSISKLKRLTPGESRRSKIHDQTVNDNNDDSSGRDASNVFDFKWYLDKTGVDPLSESKYLDKSVPDVIDESITKDRYDDCEEWEKVLNYDWGKRLELHDVSNIAMGDEVWGIVSPGVFGSIKLWENEYGNICGSAEGKLTKEGSSEMSYIAIKDVQNLRKMLGLSTHQWSCLKEMVQKNKAQLKFDAFAEHNPQSMTPLNKLWFYICKRRHFLQDQCIRVKFSGATKSMKEFKIIPKLVVQDIRDLHEEDVP